MTRGETHRAASATDTRPQKGRNTNASPTGLGRAPRAAQGWAAGQGREDGERGHTERGRQGDRHTSQGKGNKPRQAEKWAKRAKKAIQPQRVERHRLMVTTRQQVTAAPGAHTLREGHMQVCRHPQSRAAVPSRPAPSLTFHHAPQQHFWSARIPRGAQL